MGRPSRNATASGMGRITGDHAVGGDDILWIALARRDDQLAASLRQGDWMPLRHQRPRRFADDHAQDVGPRARIGDSRVIRWRRPVRSAAASAAWRGARRRDVPVSAALHVDTGMSRLGLPAEEVAELSQDPGRLEGLDLRCIMSHPACADTPEHPLNARQLGAFRRVLAALPKSSASFANSSGIFLGREYWGDLVRPGAALYGVSPVPGQQNPMRGVVRLEGRILQVREIDKGSTVGYGATHRATGRARIATVGVGYADGFLRSLSNRGSGYIGNQPVPLVGRVSMDLITFDVSGIPEPLAQPGAMIELIGPHRPVDALAAEAGTIGYEVLTALGARYARIYMPAEA